MARSMALCDPQRKPRGAGRGIPHGLTECWGRAMTILALEVSEALIAELDALASGAVGTRAGCARECLELGVSMMMPASNMAPVAGIPGAFQPLIVEK